MNKAYVGLTQEPKLQNGKGLWTVPKVLSGIALAGYLFGGFNSPDQIAAGSANQELFSQFESIVEANPTEPYSRVIELSDLMERRDEATEGVWPVFLSGYQWSIDDVGKGPGHEHKAHNNVLTYFDPTPWN